MEAMANHRDADTDGGPDTDSDATIDSVDNSVTATSLCGVTSCFNGGLCDAVTQKCKCKGHHSGAFLGWASINPICAACVLQPLICGPWITFK
jgi:hypothetical protein